MSGMAAGAEKVAGETGELQERMLQAVRDFIPEVFVHDSDMTEPEALSMLQEYNPDDYQVLKHSVLAQSDSLEEERKVKNNIPDCEQSISSVSSSNTSKDSSISSNVSGHVSETEDPCIKNGVVMYQSHVSVHVSVKAPEPYPEPEGFKIPNAFRDNPELVFLVEHDDVEKTVDNLCTAASLFISEPSAENVMSIVRQMKLAKLFPDVNLAGIVTSKAKFRFEEKYDSKTKLTLFAFEGSVKRFTTADQRVVRGRCNLLVKEIAYIAKTLTHKILELNAETGQDMALMSLTYFQTKGFPKAYEALTERSILSRNKLAAITNLLDEAGIIEKVEHWNNESKRRRRNGYRLGPNNPYAYRIKKGA